MIVRLTKRGLDAVESVCADDPGMLAEIQADQRVQGARVDVVAAYAAWVWVREALLDRAFNARGYRNRDVPQSLQGALKAVAQAVGHIDRHPALREVGVLGHHALVLHVWRLPQPDGPRIYTPYPLPGAEFVVLKPVWLHGAGKTRTTIWSPSGVGPGNDRLAEEQTQLGLWRQVVAPVAGGPHLDG